MPGIGCTNTGSSSCTTVVVDCARPSTLPQASTIGAPVSLSTESDALPLVARDPQRVAELAGEYGVTNSIARLQKALDKL